MSREDNRRQESFDESRRFDNRPDVQQTVGAQQSDGKGGHKVPLDEGRDTTTENES